MGQKHYRGVLCIRWLAHFPTLIGVGIGIGIASAGSKLTRFLMNSIPELARFVSNAVNDRAVHIQFSVSKTHVVPFDSDSDSDPDPDSR